MRREDLDKTFKVKRLKGTQLGALFFNAQILFFVKTLQNPCGSWLYCVRCNRTMWVHVEKLHQTIIKKI